MEQLNMLFQDYYPGEEVFLADWPMGIADHNVSFLGRRAEVIDTISTNFYNKDEEGIYNYGANKDYLYKVVLPEYNLPFFAHRSHLRREWKPIEVNAKSLLSIQPYPLIDVFGYNGVYTAYVDWEQRQGIVEKYTNPKSKMSIRDVLSSNCKEIDAYREKVVKELSPYKWQFYDFIENVKNNKVPELMIRKLKYNEAQGGNFENSLRVFFNNNNFAGNEDYRKARSFKKLMTNTQRHMSSHVPQLIGLFLNAYYEDRNPHYKTYKSQYVFELYIMFKRSIDALCKRVIKDKIKIYNSNSTFINLVY